MIPQFESLYTRNIDVLRNLSALSLAGSEELVRCQLNHTQALIARGSQQVKDAFAEVATAQTPVQLSNAMHTGVRNAIDIVRDCVAATSDYQSETLRMVQRQAVETQEILADTLQGFGAESEEAPAARPKRSAKAEQQEQTA